MTTAYTYDYKNQAWVMNGTYIRCGHPFDLDCGCYGRQHAGEKYEPCKHHNKAIYYTDDLVAMYGICDNCGLRIGEEL